jgi:hypothetical protein
MNQFHRYRGTPGYYQGNSGRWIANDFSAISKIVREEAGNRCEMTLLGQEHAEDCPRYDPWSEAHHRHGRGGGKRHDVIFLPDGTKNLLCLSRACHRVAKIQRRQAA